jgi:hypothetical protein
LGLDSGIYFAGICSSWGIMINSISCCFAGVLLNVFCGCFVLGCPVCPIQERVQPAMNVMASMGAKRAIASLLRFFLLTDFVILVPATYIVT